ncbi:unnamed protein product [Gulo gulo]|uniref:Uncharacterized protein n=1 Tax=Gulo gulo TaxID=48420 RepID=A0A9X9PY53_GULGU|nr:unnamed protein product [Gulo gulo]
MLVFPSRQESGFACWVVWPLRLYLGGFVVMSGICDPDYVRCVSMSDCVPISLYRVGQCAGLTMSAWRAALGCVYFASLLWGWTVCGPVRSGLCACVLVSFRSVFADRWGVEGRASRRWNRKLRRRLGGGERDFTFYSKL